MEHVIGVGIDSSGVKQGAAEVVRSTDQTIATLDKLTKTFDRLDSNMSKSRSWQKELAQEMSKTNVQISSLGDSMRKMAADTDSTNAILKKLVNFERELAQETTKTNAILRGMSQDLKAMASGYDSLGKQGQESIRMLDLEWKDLSVTLNQSWELMKNIYAVSKQGYGFVKQAAEVDELRESYMAFMKSAGLDGNKVFAQVSDAMGGMVSEANIMKETMMLVNKGITDDPEVVARLMQISEALADAAADGRTAEQVFSQLSDTIARGQVRGLAQYGLLPEYMEKASDKAEILMRKSEVLNIVLQGGSEKLEILGESGKSAADEFLKFENEIVNVGHAFGQTLLPVAREFIDYLRKDFIPGLQGVNELLKDFTTGIDAESRALQGMADKGAAAVIAQKRKQLEELSAYLDDRRNKFDVTDPDYIEKRSTRQALELEIKKLSMVGTKQNRTEIGADWLTDSYKQVKKSVSAAADAFDIFDGKVDKAAKKAKEQHSAFVDMWEELEKLTAQADRANAMAPRIANVATGGMIPNLPGLFGIEAEKLAEAGRKFASEMERARQEGEKLDDELEDMFGPFKDVLSKMNEDERDFDEGLGEDVSKLEADAFKRSQDELQKFKESMRVNVADAFGAGIEDAVNGGDFWKAFTSSLRSQLASALSAGITGSLFGVGDNQRGSFNVGSILFGSGGIGGAVSGGRAIGPDDVAVEGGSSGGGMGSSGILGGVMSKMFKPVFGANNALNWGALGSNLLTAGVAGFAVNRLFGEGGAFGSRVIHGQEQVQLSGDINSQVTQAKKQRDEMAGTLVGVSDATRQALESLQFAYSWTEKHKSGNGFTSKKTTTYEAVGVGAAQASIDEFSKLSAKATAEAAAREFQIVMREMSNPLEALNMRISDLSKSVQSANDATRLSLQQELEMANAQKGQYKSAYNASWFSNRLSTAAASAGDISVPSMERNGPYSLRDFKSNMPSHLVQLGLIQSQAQKEYNLSKLQMDAQNDPSKMADYLTARSALISDSLKTFENLMKEAAERARGAEQGTKEAEQAISDYSSAQAAFLNTRLEQIAIEKEKEKKIADANKQRQSDILSTLVTAVGESRTVAGLGQVLVIRPDDPDFTKYLKEIRDGLDGEGQRVFDQILESKYGKNRGFKA